MSQARVQAVLQAAIEKGLLPAHAQLPAQDSRPWPVVLLTAIVKGCRTPARARGKASIGTSFRAGVGQASREETAAHATVVVEGRGRYGDWRCAAGVIALSDDVRCAMGVRQSGR